ncbi:hypothetical protein ACN47E_002915 [Coniothyrium glycines]
MLIRSLRVPPSLFLLLVFLAFFGWQLSQGPSHEAMPLNFAGMGNAVQGSSGDKNTPRVALMTFVTDQRSYLHLSLRNHDHYARRHGYDFIVDYEAHTDLSVVYYKFNMAERLVASKKYDWIWWMDFDTLVTNTDIKLTDIIADALSNTTAPHEIDYLLTHDCNGLNAGSYVFRAHDRSLAFIRDAIAVQAKAQEEGQGISEQEAMVRLMELDQASRARTLVVQQQKLNAFPQEIACYDPDSKAWERGDFVIHFAGAWAHVKGDDPTGWLMKKYEGDIIWGDWKEIY